jgi:uncharacterized protein (TIGR04540 family)
MNKYDYIKHPTSVKILIQELKRICDDYIARNTPEDVLRYYVQYWATDSGRFLFNGNDGFNPTVQQRIGSKRLKLVNQMLDGMQHAL